MYSSVNNLISKALRENVFSALAISVRGPKNYTIYEGYHSLDRKYKLTEDSFFDLASITKTVIASIFCYIVDRDNFDLNTKLSKFFKDIHPILGTKTVKDLLAHSAGFVSWLPLYNYAKDKKTIYSYIRREYPQQTLSKTVYSDLSYILLGELLEIYFNNELDTIVENFLTKFKIKHMLYKPLTKGITQDKIVATGHSRIRKNILAHVNDDNAYFMGEVSGHAGLFAKAESLSRFANLILNTYLYGGELCSSELFKEFIASKDKITGYSLGWVYPTHNGQAGKRISKHSIGSLGFTGTSLWIDLDKKFTISILANRTIADSSISSSTDSDYFKEFRPVLMDSIIESLY